MASNHAQLGSELSLQQKARPNRTTAHQGNFHTTGTLMYKCTWQAQLMPLPMAPKALENPIPSIISVW